MLCYTQVGADAIDLEVRELRREYQEPRLSHNLTLVDLLAETGEAHHVSAGVIAIAWVLHNPAVTAAIVGSRHPGQVDETVAAAEFRRSLLLEDVFAWSAPRSGDSTQESE